MTATLGMVCTSRQVSALQVTQQCWVCHTVCNLIVDQQAVHNSCGSCGIGTCCSILHGDGYKNAARSGECLMNTVLACCTCLCTWYPVTHMPACETRQYRMQIKHLLTIWARQLAKVATECARLPPKQPSRCFVCFRKTVLSWACAALAGATVVDIGANISLVGAVPGVKGQFAFYNMEADCLVLLLV